MVIDTRFAAGGLVEALILFTLGGIIGLNRMNAIDFMIKWRNTALVVFFVLALVRVVSLDTEYSYLAEHGLAIVGSVAFAGLFYKMPKTLCGVNLVSLSVFIFASHAIIRFIPFYVFNRMNIDAMWLDYTLRFVFTVGLCTVVYCLGSKLCPKLLRMSVGGR